MEIIIYEGKLGDVYRRCNCSTAERHEAGRCKGRLWLHGPAGPLEKVKFSGAKTMPDTPETRAGLIRQADSGL